LILHISINQGHIVVHILMRGKLVRKGLPRGIEPTLHALRICGT
jgi:hypothetical protein